MASYEAVIGLEVHAELKTRTKMFCACRNDPNERHPNVNVCPICLGHPGTLPVPNREAIRIVQRVGAALGCELAASAKFDRKNYFYPDLPKGYQISQYDLPFSAGGALELPGGRRIRVRRVHLEEDTGRLLHPDNAPFSIVDFNRAGVPLMELVTEPDIRSSDEVALFAEELQRIFRYLRASDANMEKGEMRVEVNISLQPVEHLRGAPLRNPSSAHNHSEEAHRSDARGSSSGSVAPTGVKVEIKNLNSIRSARLAVAYEIERQSRILERGETIAQETRGWHDAKAVTFSQRSKEEAHDYRYFPEPDIPPFRFTAEELEAIRAEVPELPAARRRRFAEEYGLSSGEVAVLVDDKALGEFFEAVVSELREWLNVAASASADAVKLAANYLLSDFRGILVEHATSAEELESVTAENFAELMKFVSQGSITSRVAKDVLREMFSTGRDPSDIIEERGLRQESGEDAIRGIVAQVLSENPKPLADFRAGKEQALQFLVGKVMAASKGRANPEVARRMLIESAALEFHAEVHG